MKNILVPIDFSEVTEKVVEKAVELARAFDGTLRLVHVAAPDPYFVGYEAGPQTVRDQRADELREEHRKIQALADEIGALGVRVKPLLIEGETVATILEQAEQSEADLIVLGSHGRGALHRALVGSVSEGVLRRAARPILLIPAPRPG